MRNLRRIIGRNKTPNESTVCRLMTKFEETGSVQDATTPMRQRSRWSLFNQKMVMDGVLTSPTISLRRTSQELAIPLSLLQWITKKDLDLHPSINFNWHRNLKLVITGNVDSSLIGWTISGPTFFTMWWSELASQVVRSNSTALLSLRLRQSSRLRK